MSSLLEKMKENPLFAELTDDVLNAIVAGSQTRQYEKGQVLIEEGSESDEVFFVIEGSVQVRCVGKHAKEPTAIRTLGPGETIGEVQFVRRQPRTATVVSDDGLKVAVWRTTRWRNLCEDNYELGYRLVMGIATILCERLARADCDIALLNKIIWGSQEK